ncbi:outer membrane protein assembly factor BamB family protein [Maledivibacter halophilus]|uniref:Pyrrolo-quinoline quinone repeat domain-containing protein n=1 Tax=Maledivibacter halophilus TaxID=36842 RepID=A0A1T5KGL4_9FIRM|nr:PQQ-binding-like beta-propeller repeat protein [Maledivibacter halophilus]SKC62595.1 hypothetical protein SAMN02194393_01768 [Maledivibacter halophilus]
MNDLVLHGLGRGLSDPGVIPIEGLIPIIASDKLKGMGLPFTHRSLGILSDRKGVNHYHNGKVYVLHSLGVTIYDALSGEVIADNTHSSSSAHMIPDLASTDDSYYLAQNTKLYKYALDGSIIWEASTSRNIGCIAVETSGVYVGERYSSGSKVYKFKRTNGDKIWETASVSDYVMGLAVNETTVIVSYGNSIIKRLNCSTGADIYSYTIPNNYDSYALAIESGTNHFYSIDSKRILRKHSYQTGEPIFERTNANVCNVYNLFIDSGNNIYTVSDQEITKLDNQLSDFIWRENCSISNNDIEGFGFDKELGKIFVLRQHTARVLSTEQQWSNFIPHQFEGTINSIDVDRNGNLYGASDDCTVRKFNALGKQQWIYDHDRIMNFVRADNKGNVFVADDSQTLKKLDSLGVEQWSCSISETTGKVTDLVVNSEGIILVSITNRSNRNDYLVKISPEGSVLNVKEIGISGVFHKLYLWDDHTVLALDRLYNIDTLICLYYFNGAKAIFNVYGDFIYDLSGTSIQVFNKYSGGHMHSFTIKDVKSYLRTVQGLDGAIYAVDTNKTLVKLTERGEELWRYQARDNIADIKIDDEHNVYLATGYYIEKLTQTFQVKGYEKE